MKTPFVVLAALALLLQAGALQADDRRGHDGWRSHDRGWDRDRNHSWNRDWNRGRDHRWDHRSKSRYYDSRSRLSFNINLGSRWQPTRHYRYTNYRSSGFGYNNWRSTSRVHYLRYPQPVVQQTRYVSQPVSRSVHTGTSLLRDIEGRCFERSIDHAGHETRVELPATHCDF